MISIPKKSLKRLAHYHYYLKELASRHRDFVSNQRLASDLNLSLEQVKEDLGFLYENIGISEIHSVDVLLKKAEELLGKNNGKYAVIAGAGNLCRALMSYRGFKESFGLEILSLFDTDDRIIGQTIGGREVFHIERMEDIIKRLGVNIGIITTPPEPAQSIANRMVDAGVTAIWNFSLAVIKVPPYVALQNSSLYTDLLNLTHKMYEHNVQ